MRLKSFFFFLMTFQGTHVVHDASKPHSRLNISTLSASHINSDDDMNPPEGGSMEDAVKNQI